jgi:hypothetical protein
MFESEPMILPTKEFKSALIDQLAGCNPSRIYRLSALGESIPICFSLLAVPTESAPHYAAVFQSKLPALEQAPSEFLGTTAECKLTFSSNVPEFDFNNAMNIGGGPYTSVACSVRLFFSVSKQGHFSFATYSWVLWGKMAPQVEGSLDYVRYLTQ